MLLTLLTFAAVAALLTITPGVDTALVLRLALVGGWRAGVAASLGICLGVTLWGLAVAFGLAALLAASPVAFTLLTWAGAGYLVWLGVRMLFSRRVPAAPDGGRPASRDAGVAASFRRGLLTNALNPKIGVFYMTLLPQFIPAGANVAATSMLLAFIHIALSLVWFAVLIALTVPLARTFARPGFARAMDRLTGCVLIGFGARLALARG